MFVSACCPECQRITLPRLFVEISGQKPARLVGHERVDARNEWLRSFRAPGVPSLEMTANHFVGHPHECLVPRFAGLHLRLLTNSGHPLIAAYGRVAGFSGLWILPSSREDIVAASEEQAKQRDLLGIGHR